MIGLRKNLLSVTALSSGLSVLIAAGSAFAADAPQAAQAPNVEEVVITGSRVQRNGYEAPTPVTVMNVEEINRDAPVNIADFVNKMPVFANSVSSHNSASSVSDGNGGVNNLNLRAMGPNRTLVLFDGMRIVPSSISGFKNNGGSVDINSFPDALVSRVDVVTGGASAAYGSDALAGVVNFVLDKTFTGVKGTVEGGVTTYGDDRQYLVNLTAGTGFAGDRGHILISGQTTHNDGILNDGLANGIAPRAWLQQMRFNFPNPNYTATNGQPFMLIEPNVGSSQYSPGGLVNSGPLKGIDFGPGGVPRKFNYGPINSGTLMTGGDWLETRNIVGGGTGLGVSLDNAATRQNLFTRASYDITDDIQVYAQFMYAITNTRGSDGPSLASSYSIKNDNPFLPASVKAQMAAAGVTSMVASSFIADAGAGLSVNSRQMYDYTLGANGKVDAFDTRWTWDFAASRSISRLFASAENVLNKTNFGLASDVTTNPATGLPICRSTLTTSPNNGCVPYNSMGVGVNSQAAINYVMGTPTLDQAIHMNVLDANLHGEPFSTWAGPVSLAFGFEHRKLSVYGLNDPLSTNNVFYVGNFHATAGGYDVNEGFIETVVPLAKDQTWAKSLDLNAALRVTDYSTSGKVTTWKVGATYQPIDDIRFRATRSRDIRAPNLGELFQAGQTGTGTVRDDFKTGAPTVPEVQITVGNPALNPEEADTTGLGVVVQPTFFPGFNASFDYFKIDIGNAIATANVQQIMDLCFAGNQTLCGFIQRDPAGNVQFIYVRPANTTSAGTKGFDIEASYTQRLSDIVDSWNGTLSARVLATHVIDLVTVATTGQTLNGAGVNDGGMYPINAAPSWRSTFNLVYDTDAVTVAWTGRGISAGVHNTTYIECASACPASTTNNNTVNDNHLPGAFYMDMSFTYHLKTDSGLSSDLFFSVDNMMNKEPNFAILNFAPGIYDLLGRSFRAGVRFKM